ncbi:DNA replication protein DnaC [Neomoorella glycerini]|uniref:DNA replication protein DnaC n=1 Tax=Neomoorella glycerini TaxID=55779 RepID=A0A6I5ZQ10_9FIRM|nr:ATP-binding protein [Moorella glycerini]QGP91687.1 DNA replication protein DnaC [Moorella glycerini]
MVSDDGHQMVRQCRCAELRRQKALVERLFRQARIPKRFAGKRFDNFEVKRQERAWQVAKRYAEQYKTLKDKPQNGLCFVGPPGTGKSHLAYAILNELLPQQVVAVSGTVPDLLDSLRPKGGGNAEAEDRLELLKTAELVVLDDLGAERDSPWATERIYLIINARYAEQLPTIITSNLPLEELETGADGEVNLAWERIVSRIWEMCYVVIMDGDDYRRKDD